MLRQRKLPYIIVAGIIILCSLIWSEVIGSTAGSGDTGSQEQWGQGFGGTIPTRTPGCQPTCTPPVCQPTCTPPVCQPTCTPPVCNPTCTPIPQRTNTPTPVATNTSTPVPTNTSTPELTNTPTTEVTNTPTTEVTNTPTPEIEFNVYLPLISRP